MIFGSTKFKNCSKPAVSFILPTSVSNDFIHSTDECQMKSFEKMNTLLSAVFELLIFVKNIKMDKYYNANKYIEIKKKNQDIDLRNFHFNHLCQINQDIDLKNYSFNNSCY